jgi:peptidoglycan hydrolase CwlO-like protein
MKGFAGGLKDQLAAKIESLDTQVAELQQGIRERELWMDASAKERDQLAARMKTLEEALTIAEEGLMRNHAYGYAEEAREALAAKETK